MKIAIDIDKTLLDCNSALYEIINSSFSGQKGDKKLKFHFLRGEDFKISSILARINNMYNHRAYSMCENCNEIINKLYNDGHEIILLSSRPKGKSLCAALLYCINKFEICCSDVVIACNNKVSYCLQENIDILIDNSYVTCSHASMKGIRSICYIRNFSTDNLETNSNLFICKSWDEIGQKTEELITEKKQENKRI